jgi:rSAM/selenodomain-associated transferase 1
MTAAIAIICKAPRPGASKTRLVPLLGADGAAELASSFLRDIVSVIEAIPEAVDWKGWAVYAPQDAEAEVKRLLPPRFDLLCRRDASLGNVLLGATEYFLAERYDCVVLVNADSPTMPVLLLTAALAALRAPGDRVVLGPATDGGYYLIGLKRAHAPLFTGIPWSTSGVLAATRTRAAEAGITIAELPPWYDIDDTESFEMLLDELSGKPLKFNAGQLVSGPAVATRAFLSRREMSTAGFRSRSNNTAHL